MAFSSKFQLKGMTGNFNSTVQDAINGKAGGDGHATVSSSAASSASAKPSTSTNSAVANATPITNSNSATTGNGTDTSGAERLVGGTFVGLGAVMVGVVALL